MRGTRKSIYKVSSEDSVQQQTMSKADLKDTVIRQIDMLFQDCDFISKISKILFDSLIEPIKKVLQFFHRMQP